MYYIYKHIKSGKYYIFNDEHIKNIKIEKYELLYSFNDYKVIMDFYEKLQNISD